MLQKYFLIFFILSGVTQAVKSYKNRNFPEKHTEGIREKSIDEPGGHAKKYTDTHAGYNPLHTNKGEAIVEKFVETLMSSERYLKMIETVERKLNHLDATFHERTNTMLKYVSEMLRVLKTGPPERTEASESGTLRVIKSEIDKLKMFVSERLDHPRMRADGADVHLDPSLDSRLTVMEGQIKSIMSGVESIVAIISEVKSRQVSRTYQKGDTTSLDSMNLLYEFRKSLHDQKRKCDCKSGRVDRSERYPTDCHEIQMQGFNVSGIYKIKPEDMEPFYVLCDLTTAGGGWTVLQNRFDGSQDFYKPWNDYKNGFGNLAGEFWLGLEKVNCLTNQKLYELRIEIETQHGQEAYAGYSVFTVGPEHEGFRISTLGTYYGTAGDSLSYHAGQKFSTIDVDNDEWKDGACAVEHGGAWWYKECDKSNLNGKYSTTAEEHRGQTIYWISFKGPNFPLIKTKMMIRPLPASRPNDLADPARKHLGSSNSKPERQGIHAINRKGEYQTTNSHLPLYTSENEPTRSHPPRRYDKLAGTFFPSYK